MAKLADTPVNLGGLPTPAAALTNCAHCRHPVALHGNGTTECKAFACMAGPSIQCPDCGGYPNLVPGEPCKTCARTPGTVRLSCRAFESADQVSLAS